MNELAEFELRRFIRFRPGEPHSNAEQIVNELRGTEFLRNMLRHWVETEGLWMNYEGMMRGLEFYEERNRQRRGSGASPERAFSNRTQRGVRPGGTHAAILTLI